MENYLCKCTQCKWEGVTDPLIGCPECGGQLIAEMKIMEDEK